MLHIGLFTLHTKKLKEQAEASDSSQTKPNISFKKSEKLRTFHVMVLFDFILQSFSLITFFFGLIIIYDVHKNDPN